MPRYLWVYILFTCAFPVLGQARIGEHLNEIKQRLGKHLTYDKVRHKAIWSLGKNRSVYYVVEVDSKQISVAERLKPAPGHTLKQEYVKQFVDKQLSQLEAMAKDPSDLSMQTWPEGSVIPFGGQGFVVPRRGVGFLFPKLHVLMVADYGSNPSVSIISLNWVETEGRRGVSSPQEILDF